MPEGILVSPSIVELKQWPHKALLDVQVLYPVDDRAARESWTMDELGSVPKLVTPVCVFPCFPPTKGTRCMVNGQWSMIQGPRWRGIECEDADDVALSSRRMGRSVDRPRIRRPGATAKTLSPCTGVACLACPLDSASSRFRPTNCM